MAKSKEEKVVDEAMAAYRRAVQEQVMMQAPRYVATYSTTAMAPTFIGTTAMANPGFYWIDGATVGTGMTVTYTMPRDVLTESPPAPAKAAPKKHKPAKPPGLKGGVIEPFELM